MMININGVEWDIKFVPSTHPILQRSSGEYAMGVCDGSQRIIALSEDIPRWMLHGILAHEITHAAMFSYDIDLSLEQEELVADLIEDFGSEILKTTCSAVKML